MDSLSADDQTTVSAATTEAVTAAAVAPPLSMTMGDELEAVLARLLPDNSSAEESELDREGPFDALAVLNRLFPNEQSLVNIDQVMSRMQTYTRNLEEDIREIVRSQTNAGEEGKRELEDAKRAIEELCAKIDKIKSRAKQSEEMVQHITKDIKSLDLAKKNLAVSIKVLENFKMLVSTVEQLKVMTKKKQYEQIVPNLKNAQQFVTYFDGYKNIRKIQDIASTVSALQTDLKRQIITDFYNSFNPMGNLIGDEALLHNGCLVLQNLEPDGQMKVTEFYIDCVLREYRTTFLSGGEVSYLENVSLRYSWLKRALETRRQQIVNIFPISWKLMHLIGERFAAETSSDLSNILLNNTNLDVKILLRELKATMEFESQLCNHIMAFVPEDGGGGTYGVAMELEPPENESEAAAIKRKYRQRNQAQKKKADPIPAIQFLGSISKCFEPYLKHYIQAEKKSLQELIDRFAKDDAVPTEEGQQQSIYPSSTDLFMFYKNSLSRCSKLSVKSPLLDLAGVFGEFLVIYYDHLKSKFPIDVENRKSLVAEDIKTVCTILNTAEYCYHTVSQLENKIKDKIAPEYAEKVNLGNEQELFLNIVADTTKTLSKIILVNCDAAFTAMIRTDWTATEKVGDQSEYVNQLGKTIHERVTTVHKLISDEKYFRTFCNRFAESFIANHISNIYKCKPITDIAAEQLLLDTQVLKKILINAGSEMDERFLAAYTKLVNKGMNKAEVILKIVMTPHDNPSVFVNNYILLFADYDKTNYQRILDLKGIKMRTEIQALLEAFEKHLPSTPSGHSAFTTSSAATHDSPSGTGTGMALPTGTELRDRAAKTYKTIEKNLNFNKSLFTIKRSVSGNAASGSNASGGSGNAAGGGSN